MQAFTLVCLLALLSASNASVLINKCCPSDQQLNAYLRTCVPYGDSESRPLRVAQQKVAELRAQNVSFPWWMDANATVIDPRTNQSVESFFSEQNKDRFVRYGRQRPCDWGRTKYVSTSSDNHQLLVNGTLLLNVSGQLGRISLDPDEYCVDRVDYPTSNQIFVYLMCPCDQVRCINKCCPRTKMFAVAEQRKEVSLDCSGIDEDPFEIRFHHNSTHELTDELGYILLERTVPDCQDGHNEVLLNEDMDANERAFWIFPNESVLVEEYGFGIPYTSENYCVERARFENGRIMDNIYFCSKLNNDKTPSTAGLLYGSLFAISCVFLIFTLFVYAIVPELRDTFHGKVFMSHVAAMLLASLFLSIGQLKGTYSPPMCYTIACVVQYSFIAAFFWLNVMCIDIARTFSTLQVHQINTHKSNKKKFIYFSIYAWGCPLIISIVTAILEFEETVPKHVIKPDFGVKTCWFSSMDATLAYFYGPISVLLVVNLLLFSFTAYRIWMMHRDTAVLDNVESGRHGASSQDKKRLLLYLKLFSLMGVTWVMEVVSWAHGMNILYYITDIVNILRAVFIFVIFCCKRKVLRSLREQMVARGLLPKSRDGSTTSGITMTTLALPTRSGSNDKQSIWPPSPNPSTASHITAVSAESGEKVEKGGGGIAKENEDEGREDTRKGGEEENGRVNPSFLAE